MVDAHAEDEDPDEEHWFKEAPLECSDEEDRELDTDGEAESPLTPEELEKLDREEIDYRFSSNLKRSLIEEGEAASRASPEK